MSSGVADQQVAPKRSARRGWIDNWDPEDPQFWETTGRIVARRNLVFSILAEHLAFSVWVLWSIVAASWRTTCPGCSPPQARATEGITRSIANTTVQLRPPNLGTAKVYGSRSVAPTRLDTATSQKSWLSVNPKPTPFRFTREGVLVAGPTLEVRQLAGSSPSSPWPGWSPSAVRRSSWTAARSRCSGSWSTGWTGSTRCLTATRSARRT